jgi:hypothetical protein
MKPMIIAPRTAPVRFPIPPRTAAVNAISPSSKPVSYRMLNWRRKSIPATAASDPASANVTEIVRLTLIPIIAAASRSCAIARIPFPCRVCDTNHVSASSAGTVISRTMNLFQAYATSPISNTGDLGSSSLAPRKSTS